MIRESGGDRSAVTGGTIVLSDRIVVQVTSNPGETFLDRMIALVEGASRQKTPNEVALDILIAGLTLILLVAVVTLQPMAIYDQAIQSTAVLIALFVCLAPTTIGGLLSAIGIAGMDRMVQRNVLATSGRAVEAAGDCSTLLLDKTGTITYGNRMAAEFIPVAGVTGRELGEAAYLSSMADETPEGRSIVDLAESRYPLVPPEMADAGLVPFSAQTRMSGIDLGPRRIRKGAADSVRRWVEDAGGVIPRDLAPVVERIASGGGTPLVVADGRGRRTPRTPPTPRVLGVIHLKDTVKAGMTERFRQLRDMGIRTVMITGDNPLTARAIAAEAGVDDFLAEATMGTTAGATDSALDSYTPVGGTGAFAGILLGEISPGGDGGGLYTILVLSLLAVFVAGLMVGRTPEFLGKKIRAPQMKLIIAYVLALPTTILIFGGISLVIRAGTALDPQSRLPRPDRGHLRLRLGGAEQRLGLRRAGGEHAVVRHDARPDHADRPVRADRAGAGHRRLTRRGAGTRAHPGHARHRRADVRRVPAGRDRDRRRPDLLPHAHPRPDRRAHRRMR